MQDNQGDLTLVERLQGLIDHHLHKAAYWSAKKNARPARLIRPTQPVSPSAILIRNSPRQPNRARADGHPAFSRSRHIRYW